MPLKMIKFGTSGWRGILADDFTFEGVRAATAAIADYVKQQNSDKPSLVIGFDPRFLSDTFAREAAAILTGRGVQSFLCQHPTPTPAIAYEVLLQKADGAINFTASHNPAEYNGLKFSTADGAPALKHVTKALEALAAKHLSAGVDAGKMDESKLEPIDPAPAYLGTLATKVDINAIQQAGISIGFDPLYGAATGYLDKFLADLGVEVFSLHTHRDALFGGHPPEPSDEILSELRSLVKERNAAVGLSCDGDADRFGILDGDGTFISPNHIIGLLIDYLFETRPDWPRAVARSVATTHLVDAVAKHHKAKIHETPVGFKYIGELIKENKITLGGEESAGLSVYGHVPEKDGILACLLVAEMIATKGKSLTGQLADLFTRVGAYYPVRANLQLSPEVQQEALKRIQNDPAKLAGRTITKVDRTDGLKLFLEDDAWVLMRPSGTEPVVRCYAESHSEKETAALVESARKFLLE
jgi:alpha-D-glucose phosphate-specific phosphoglucomutase